ncbi:MAG: hypothetical protein R3F43_27165 [bacterium]
MTAAPTVAPTRAHQTAAPTRARRTAAPMPASRPRGGQPDAAPDAPDGQACAPGRHGLDWTALAFCAPEGVPAGLRPYRGQTSPFLVDADLVTAG